MSNGEFWPIHNLCWLKFSIEFPFLSLTTMFLKFQSRNTSPIISYLIQDYKRNPGYFLSSSAPLDLRCPQFSVSLKIVAVSASLYLHWLNRKMSHFSFERDLVCEVPETKVCSLIFQFSNHQPAVIWYSSGAVQEVPVGQSLVQLMPGHSAVNWRSGKPSSQTAVARAPHSSP